ncbi:MAG: nuclear transport factor 2 family protein [Alphaproteobacteria bacterium]|nr:nuclear transport factor 2 family protein [Alphaproteobacteria bacterium]
MRLMNLGGRAALALAVLAGLSAPPAPAAEAQADPILLIRHDGGARTYSARELLARPDVEEIAIADVGAYPGQEMTFRAVTMARLLEGVPMPRDASVEFLARDGFATSLAPDILANTAPGGAIAYLAVEDPARKWPPLPRREVSPGPFYLVWIHPELSGIGREEWPFMIDRIEVKSSLETLYPAIVPAADVPDGDPIRAGFAAFAKNCLACHTMNGQGPGRVGPDLNVPMSPLDYFAEGVARQFIRDSQSVRANPNTPMGPFGTDILPDAALDGILAYMRHMAGRRAAPDPAPAPRDEIAALVTASLESWETRDRDQFRATAHEDLVFAFPGRRTDLAGALAVFDKWSAEYEDTKVYIRRILVEGDAFAAEYQFATTRKDTGRRSVAGTVALGRVADGKIVLIKEYLDGRVSRGQEAGLMPLDEGAEPFPWPPIDLTEVDFSKVFAPASVAAPKPGP